VKLSVIIPAYNRAEMIQDTIDSILRSGLDDFEIVVVDDGSTDRTSEVVRAMSPAVRYIHQDNGGLASARNTGFEASRGRYVAFLDSDDQWFPGAVPALVRHLDEHEDVPFIFGDAQMGSPSTGYVSFVKTFGGAEFEALPSRDLGPNVRQFERRPLFWQLARRNFVFLGSMVLRREVVDHVGGFDPYPYGAEDWHLFLRLALRYHYCYCNGLAVATYQQHSSNISKDQDRMNDGFCKALERLLDEPQLEGDERALVVSCFRRSSFCYAYPAYDRGDFDVASERFFACLRSGFAWAPFLYWLACKLPSSWIKRARFLKQRYLGRESTRSAVKGNWESSY
jgi:glycosyltransferase involved in cell wall biosynthesis